VTTRDTSERREARRAPIRRGKVTDREKTQCNPVRCAGIAAWPPTPIRRDVLHTSRVGGELYRSSPAGGQRKDVTYSRRVLIDRGTQVRPQPIKPFTPQPRPKHSKLPHSGRLPPRPQPTHDPQAYAIPSLPPRPVRIQPPPARRAPIIGPNPCGVANRAEYRQVVSKGETTPHTART
jgi:hypothetical protein